MSHHHDLVDQIIRHEGLRLKPYTDTVGKLTIGVGRNLTDNGITSGEAMTLLDHDLDACVADLVTFPWFVGLDAVRQRVLVNMRFNLGPSRFRAFKATIAAVASGDYVKASERMLQSKWAGQVKGRALELARMMATGLALLLLAAPVAAQSHLGTVQQVRRDLTARGIIPAGIVNLDNSNPCGVFEISKRVAWLLRAEGAGLLRKTDGNNCGGYSMDWVTYADGRGADIAGGGNFDGVQTDATPQWKLEVMPEHVGRWVQPFDPGDTPAPIPVPIPVPIPPPFPVPVPVPPPTDPISWIVQALVRLETKQDAGIATSQREHITIIATVNAPGWFEKIVKNPLFVAITSGLATWITTALVKK